MFGLIILDSTPLLQQAWFIVLMVIIGSVLAALLFVFLLVFAIRQSEKRQVKELENRYNDLHTSFTNDCTNMIKRVESISYQTASYVKIYDSMTNRYGAILTNNDKQCFFSVDTLKKMVVNKNFKEIKPIIGTTRSSMDAFEKASTALNADLSSLLHPEDECRAESVVLKEKFRSLKEKHDVNSTALASLEPSFEKLFTHISKTFTDFEEYLNKADYKEAKELLPKAEVLVDAADKIMPELPYLNTCCDKVIPDKIASLEESYKEMEANNYPLHHLHVPEAIKAMREQVSLAKDKLNKLSISGISETFDGITTQINGFVGAFEKEKEAKKEFDSLTSSIDSSTYTCEKSYANLRNSLPNYCKVYKIDQTYLSQIDIIKDMIDEMSTKKRVLDSYINSSTKLPYSMLVTTITELNNKIKLIEKAFSDFHDYLVSLKDDTDRAYKFVRQAYEDLMKDRLVVREINIDSFGEIITPRIEKGMNMITNLDKSLRVYPIDVIKINEDYKEAEEHISHLNEDVSEGHKAAERAEDLMVYDNKYRLDSLSTRQKLENAEKAFLEADFTRASDVAASAYKEMSAHK